MRRVVPLLAILLVTACGTVRVSVDYDPEEDFSVYRTYAWLPGSPEATGHPRLDTPMVHQRVREAVDGVLRGKGFTKVAEEPDFWVTYHMSVQGKVDVRTTDRFYPTRYGWTVSIPETTVDEYEEGTVVIDIADAREKELVWRGIGRGRMRRQAPDPEEQRATALQVANEILADFPPGRPV